MLMTKDPWGVPAMPYGDVLLNKVVL